MAAVEPEPHRPFAATTVAVVGLAEPVADVVVHHAVVHERALPVELAAGVGLRLGNLVGGTVGVALVEIPFARDQRVDRQRSHHLRRVGMAEAVRVHGASPWLVGRHAVVREGRKVQRRVARQGNPHRGRTVGRGDPVPEQRPVLPRGNPRRINPVPRVGVPLTAVVAHRELLPVFRRLKLRVDGERLAGIGE